MLTKRYITEDEMTQCVVGIMPTLEFTHKTHRELTRLALEWFADDLEVIANISACRVVASRCLAGWEGTKIKTFKEVQGA
jgi:hypothetical protein